MEIKKQLTTCPKEKPKDESKLGFGHIFTDHMLVMPYDEGQGWHDPVIMPYGDITLSPSAMCLHYGQTVFEGLKAYRRADGGVQLFRPDENFKRLNRSNERLVIPELPEELGLQCLKELISVEKDWVPHTEGASLYIRPFIFAVDPFLGVHPGEHYLFMIILSPSGPYYASGLDPVNIYVENKYVRTVRGGMGYAKTGGNYAASLHSQADAYEQGYSQVLWLDGVEQKYIEEVGAMNIAFVIDGEVVTPSLETGSILSGITRKSALELCRSKGIPVSERRITIQEIADAYDAGKLSEVFGTGTAAVISPVGHLKWGDKVMTINNNKIGPVSQMIYDTLTGIQWGKIPDEFGWIVPIDCACCDRFFLPKPVQPAGSAAGLTVQTRGNFRYCRRKRWKPCTVWVFRRSWFRRERSRHLRHRRCGARNCSSVPCSAKPAVPWGRKSPLTARSGRSA